MGRRRKGASVTIEIPYQYLLSKNGFHKISNNRKYVPKEAKQAKQAVVDALKAAEETWFFGYTTVNIHVVKHNKTLDAHNVVGVLCDAIQEATGINDSWYEVHVTWEFNPPNAGITVTVTQEHIEHLQICGSCCQYMTLDRFPPSNRSPSGHHGICKVCTRLKMKAWVEDNRQRVKDYGIQWRRNNKNGKS